MPKEVSIASSRPRTASLRRRGQDDQRSQAVAARRKSPTETSRLPVAADRERLQGWDDERRDPAIEVLTMGAGVLGEGPHKLQASGLGRGVVRASLDPTIQFNHAGASPSGPRHRVLIPASAGSNPAAPAS